MLAVVLAAQGLLRAGEWIWQTPAGDSAPTNRSFLTAVWTGSEVIFWGGQARSGSDQWLPSGYRYRPDTRVWKAMTTNGAPTARYLHSALWTGREMIIWGGQPASSHALANTGGRYDPTTDTWRATSTVNAPAGRLMHTAVWTGTEMLVWGGNDTDGEDLNTGGCYDPVRDTWMPTATTNAPAGRSDAVAVWTGREMLVWGGYDLKCSDWTCHNEYPESLGRYDPVSNTWITRASLPGAPSPRAGCTAIWDGRQMIIWGGYDGKTYGNRTRLQTGARFDPATEVWTLTSLVQAPSPRDQHVAAWTGNEMIIWGGIPDTLTGGHYHVETGAWTAGTTNNAPRQLTAGKAAWTGEALLTFTGDRLHAYFEAGLYAQDGLPDDWQKRYFGPGNPQGMPDADYDRDGQDNRLEYAAGSDPTDAASRLRLWCERVTGVGPRFRVGFSPYFDDRGYTLWQTTRLATQPFSPVYGVGTNEDGATRWITLPPSNEPSGFLRLRISRP